MELINIIFQVCLFFIIFSSGSFVFKFNKNFSVIKTNLIQHLIFNIIIHINILLFLSFLNIQINKILLIYLVLISILSILFFKNSSLNFDYIKKNYINIFTLLLICLVISVDVSHSLSLGWDSQKFWIYKTINFFDGGVIESLKSLEKGDGYDYPYLGSLLWSIFWKISYINEEYFGRLFFVFLYVLSIFSLADRLNAPLTTKIIFSILLILLSYDYIYFKGEQDILIFCFISFISSLCVEIIKNKKEKNIYSNFFLLILLCNCLVWTKAEGFIYALIVILSIIIFFKIKKNFKIFLILSLFILFLIRILIYKIYDLNIGVNSCCWNDLSPNGIISKINLERIFLILEYFIYSVLKNYLIILGSIFFIFSTRKFKLIKQNLYNYSFIILSFGFIFTAYILTDIELIFMLKTGLDRLLFQISPFFIIIIIEYFNNHKLKF